MSHRGGGGVTGSSCSLAPQIPWASTQVFLTSRFTLRSALCAALVIRTWFLWELGIEAAVGCRGIPDATLGLSTALGGEPDL